MASPESPLIALRRARLQEWIDRRYRGSQTAFAKAAGINHGELSGLLRSKSFGERRAATLEASAGMPPGYLVQPGITEHPTPADAYPLPDASLLSEAHTLLSSARKYDLRKTEDAQAFVDAYRTAAQRRITQEGQEEDVSALFTEWQERIESMSAELEELRKRLPRAKTTTR